MHVSSLGSVVLDAWLAELDRHTSWFNTRLAVQGTCLTWVLA